MKRNNQNHKHNRENRLTPMETKRHMCNFHIAGLTYYDACEVMNELKIGIKLTLIRDENNKYDPNAIAIYLRDTKLGFVPATKAAELAIYFDMGYADIFEARVQSKDTAAHPEKQIGVKISLLKNR